MIEYRMIWNLIWNFDWFDWMVLMIVKLFFWMYLLWLLKILYIKVMFIWIKNIFKNWNNFVKSNIVNYIFVII